MKKIILALALTLGFGVSAMAADLSSVGTKSTEAVVDYNYARQSGEPGWLSTHAGLAGLQLNGGQLGSLVGEAGGTRTYTNVVTNRSAFSVGYYNALDLNFVKLVGGVSWGVLTGTKWFPEGETSATPTRALSYTAEALVPVVTNVKLFTNYTYTDVQHSSNAEAGSVGVYLDVNKSLTGKVGYTRSSFNGVNFNGVVAGLAVKF